MRIVLATPIYPPVTGGPATYTKELAERLHEHHTITIVAYTDDGPVFPHTTLIRIATHLPLPLRLLHYTIALWRSAADADVIYAQNAFAAGLPAVIVGHLRRIPVIIKVVGDEAWERATQARMTTKRLEEFLASPEGSPRIHLMMRLAGWVLRHATIITTPSAYLLAEMQQAYRFKKECGVVNYNAADDTPSAVTDTERIPHRLAVTARLVAWKGIDGIIRALAKVRATIPDAHLIVAGDGPEREALEKLARSLSLATAVTFLGNVSRTETRALRDTAELYILNSTYEGLPHTVLTSFTASIPVIATNIPGTDEAVFHEDSGLLVPPRDDQALANAIIRLFGDKELQRRLVQGGHRVVQEKFSWEAHLATLETIFTRIVR